MKLSAALAGLVALSLLAGCSSAPPLVGTWTGKVNSPGGDGEMEMHFDAAGTMSQTTKMTVVGQSISMKINGTYKADKEKIDITVSGIEVLEAPAQFKEFMEKDATGAKGKTMNVPYKIEGDTLHYGPVQSPSLPGGGGGEAMTFTRKK